MAAHEQETIWFGDIPVATIRPKTGGFDIFYVHTDHLNQPRKITRPSDNKKRWEFHPNPFGDGTANENPEALGAFKYHLRFPGQYFDIESNMAYNYLRDYDPVVGRYVESDPIGLKGGINTYAYADGNPIWKYDEDGTTSISIPLPGIRIPTPNPVATAGAVGAAVGTAIYNEFGQSIVDYLVIVGRGKWTCTATCNVQQIDKCANCPPRVSGTARGPSEEQACRAAKRTATQSTPAGCYPRHCKCDCYKN